MESLTRREFAAASAAVVAGAAVPATGQAAICPPGTLPAGSMTPDERKAMGERFRLAREAMPSHWPVDDVCRNGRLSIAELQAVEAGQLEPTALQAYCLASYFNLQLSWLLGKTNVRYHHAADGCDGFHNDVADQIRHAREQADLSAYQTALALNVPVAYWEEIESGDRTLDFALGVRACVLFGADPENIVRPDDGDRPPDTKAAG